MFHAAGYATAHIGKWHLGSGLGHKPLDQGFDYSFGFMGGCIDNYTHFFYWGGANRHDLRENNQRVRLPGHYFPNLMVEKAEAFIAAHPTQPFFMYFAINMPHYPYQGDEKWLRHYRTLPYPRNLYAAFVSTLDERVDRLVKYLDFGPGALKRGICPETSSPTHEQMPVMSRIPEGNRVEAGPESNCCMVQKGITLQVKCRLCASYRCWTVTFEFCSCRCSLPFSPQSAWFRSRRPR